MSDEPFVPWYAPYGMSQEEFEYERASAQKRHDEWVEEQMIQEAMEKEMQEQMEDCEKSRRAL